VDVKSTGMLSEKGAFTYVNTQQASTGANEVQKVEIQSSGSGSFTLSLQVGGTTYTTTGIEFGANAATVRYALNAALGTKGSVEVTSSLKGTYIVTFTGALASQNVATLSVNLSNTSQAPSGQFKLSFGGQTTNNITYSNDGAVLAKRSDGARKPEQHRFGQHQGQLQLRAIQHRRPQPGPAIHWQSLANQRVLGQLGQPHTGPCQCHLANRVRRPQCHSSKTMGDPGQ